MRIIPLTFAILIAALVAPRAAHAAGSASVHAILIIASNTKGGSDPRLAPYEANLRRMFRFESYRFAGEGATAITVPGHASLALEGGHRLELESDKSTGPTVHLKVRWTANGGTLLNTTLALSRGSPAVLIRDRGSDKGQVPIVIVTAN